jgi:hypothetical protein
MENKHQSFTAVFRMTHHNTANQHHQLASSLVPTGDSTLRLPPEHTRRCIKASVAIVTRHITDVLCAGSAQQCDELARWLNAVTSGRGGNVPHQLLLTGPAYNGKSIICDVVLALMSTVCVPPPRVLLVRVQSLQDLLNQCTTLEGGDDDTTALRILDVRADCWSPAEVAAACLALMSHNANGADTSVRASRVACVVSGSNEQRAAKMNGQQQPMATTNTTPHCLRFRCSCLPIAIQSDAEQRSAYRHRVYAARATMR